LFICSWQVAIVAAELPWMLPPLLLLLAAAGITWLQGRIQLHTCYWLLYCISQHHCLAAQCLLWQLACATFLQQHCTCCNKCRLLQLRADIQQ
jgi:hypothetical protein